MAVNLTLTPDIEQALTEEASDRGTTPELLALDTLRRLFVRQPDNGARSASSLAELIAEQVGVLSSSEKVPGGARMSEACGSKLAEALVEKRRRQQL